jgi:hypothetical protein
MNSRPGWTCRFAPSPGEVWLTYNDPHWIGERHELGYKSKSVLSAVETGMAGLARLATGG